MNKKTYVKPERKRLAFLRAELWLSPLLIIGPILVSLLMIGNWYIYGYSLETSTYDGQLLLGILILLGNLLFDIPFIKHLKTTKPIRIYLINRIL